MTMMTCAAASRPCIANFDEATAILAGDSLLTLAFDIIASDENPLSPDRKVALVLSLARAAGIGGMAGGQALDLAAEKNPPDEPGVVTLQAMKNGRPAALCLRGWRADCWQ